MMVAVSTSAQINTYRPKQKATSAIDSVALAPYDSTYTFVRGKLRALIGQDIQFIPSKWHERKGEYTSFQLLHNKNEKHHPLVHDNPESPRYAALANKVFHILDVDSIVEDNRFFKSLDYRLAVSNPYYQDTVYISLPTIMEFKEYGKIPKYEDFHDYNFDNVIILGYFEKLRSYLVGSSVLVKFSNNKCESGDYVLYNIENNEPLSSIAKNKKLKVLDIGIVEGTEHGGLQYILSDTDSPKYYARLTPKNFIGAKPITQQDKNRVAWERNMIVRYGNANGNLIIQHKVKIGFTKKMCEEAWGKPESINETVGSWGTHEQWVYDLGCYLYFENGILTAIDN